MAGLYRFVYRRRTMRPRNAVHNCFLYGHRTTTLTTFINVCKVGSNYFKIFVFLGSNVVWQRITYETCNTPSSLSCSVITCGGGTQQSTSTRVHNPNPAPECKGEQNKSRYKLKTFFLIAVLFGKTDTLV